MKILRRHSCWIASQRDPGLASVATRPVKQTHTYIFVQFTFYYSLVPLTRVYSPLLTQYQFRFKLEGWRKVVFLCHGRNWFYLIVPTFRLFEESYLRVIRFYVFAVWFWNYLGLLLITESIEIMQDNFNVKGVHSIDWLYSYSITRDLFNFLNNIYGLHTPLQRHIINKSTNLKIYNKLGPFLFSFQ